LLGMNYAGDANEYKTLSSEPNIIITHSEGDISLNTAQDIQTMSSPTFNALKLSGLTPNSGVYTNDTSLLTTTPPSSGIIGYWERNNITGLLSPSNSGDNIILIGSLTADSIIKLGGLSTEFLKADGSVDTNSYLMGNESITFAATGDVTGTTTGTTNLSPTLTISDNAVISAKIADNAVTDAKFRQEWD